MTKPPEGYVGFALTSTLKDELVSIASTVLRNQEYAMFKDTMLKALTLVAVMDGKLPDSEGKCCPAVDVVQGFLIHVVAASMYLSRIERDIETRKPQTKSGDGPIVVDDSSTAVH